MLFRSLWALYLRCVAYLSWKTLQVLVERQGSLLCHLTQAGVGETLQLSSCLGKRQPRIARPSVRKGKWQTDTFSLFMFCRAEEFSSLVP